MICQVIIVCEREKPRLPPNAESKTPITIFHITCYLLITFDMKVIWSLQAFIMKFEKLPRFSDIKLKVNVCGYKIKHYIGLLTITFTYQVAALFLPSHTSGSALCPGISTLQEFPISSLRPVSYIETEHAWPSIISSRTDLDIIKTINN